MVLPELSMVAIEDRAPLPAVGDHAAPAIAASTTPPSTAMDSTRAEPAISIVVPAPPPRVSPSSGHPVRHVAGSLTLCVVSPAGNGPR